MAKSPIDSIDSDCGRRAQTGARFYEALRTTGLTNFRVELLDEDFLAASRTIMAYQRLLAGKMDAGSLLDQHSGKYRCHTAGNLLQRLDTVKVIRCDEVQWRFLGLSLAGYNVLISLLMAAIAAWGIRKLATRKG